MKRAYLLFLAALLFLANGRPLGADWGKRSLQQLTESASLIVEARVAEVTSKMEVVKGRNRIFTYVTLVLAKEFKGHHSNDKLTVRMRGGKVGNRVGWSSTFMKTTEGEEAIFFLARDENAYWKIFSASGKLQISAKDGIRQIDTSLLRNDEYGQYGVGSKTHYLEIEQRIHAYLSESR